MKISFPDFQFTLDGRVRKLFRMLRTCIAFLVALCVSPAFAGEESSSQDLFQKGLAAYQNRKYDEARDDFQKILDQGTVSARLLHNMALTFYQMNQKPRALAFWRKALAIDPNFRAARAGRDLLEGRMGMRPFERDSFNLWVRRTLDYLSFYEVLWVMCLGLTITGWLWIRYAADRRHAVDEERPLPGFPTAATVLSMILIAVVGLLGLKISELATRRATIVVDKASVRSLPADDGVSLFEINGGTEVLVRREQNGWKQIQNPEGSTGWVKDDQILVSSEG